MVWEFGGWKKWDVWDGFGSVLMLVFGVFVNFSCHFDGLLMFLEFSGFCLVVVMIFRRFVVQLSCSNKGSLTVLRSFFSIVCRFFHFVCG